MGQAVDLIKRNWHRVAVFGVFLFLFAMDFPRTQVDDLYYLIPALAAAKGHGLVGEGLGLFMDPLGTDRFLLLPPIHAWVVSIWLRIFQISPCSIRLFVNVCLALQVIAMERLLSRGILGEMHKDHEKRFYFACSGILTWFYLEYGQRPEALGLTVCLWGFYSSISLQAWLRTLGQMGLALACAIAPNLLPVALVFWIRGRSLRKLPIKNWLLESFIGIAASIFLVHLIIHGEWRQLTRQLEYMARYRTIDFSGRIPFGLGRFFSGWNPLVRLPPLALAVVLASWNRFRGAGMAFMLGIAVCLVYRPEHFRISVLLAVLAGMAFSLGFKRPRAIQVAVILCVVPIFIPTAFWGLSVEKPVYNCATNRNYALKDTVALDDVAARYYFCYDLPPTWVHAAHLHPLPDYVPNPSDLKRPWSWVMSQWTAEVHFPASGFAAPRLKVLGRTLNDYPENPWEMIRR